MAVQEKAAKIKLVIFDVDGVLTDGTLVIGEKGELAKKFNSRDGLGITLLRRSSIKTAIITGRESEIVKRRAAELKISDVYQNAPNKLEKYEQLKEKYSLNDKEIAYVGDDLIDLPVMLKAGFSCAVGDADAEVRLRADFVTKADGGRGAVRELCEFILKAQGKWQAVLESYISGAKVNEAGQ